ncbi:hypothetical protein FLM55_04680 [Francisella sp. Scap27]|uniref:hypothetical protein n=1 Tax=Francisella sp. Scap27 TaxID=2589986 RepID=UPI0015B84D2B|nr:hypothetical protein [Francisella sp. Scap27]QLE79068.1 hypothetical protein FLM55_04680 [Francisella sp. Scap27]
MSSIDSNSHKYCNSKDSTDGKCIDLPFRETAVVIRRVNSPKNPYEFMINSDKNDDQAEIRIYNISDKSRQNLERTLEQVLKLDTDQYRKSISHGLTIK